jgi:PAS domain S-box-containing protein
MSNNQPHATPHMLRFLVEGRLNRLAWLPIPLLLAAMSVLWAADLRTAHESPFLLTSLNFVFLTMASLLVVVLVGRSFLASGETGLLMLGCGVLLWGMGGTIGPAVLGHGINATVTVHNILAWLAALCHLTGIVLSRKQRQAIRLPGLTLVLAYAVTLCVAWLAAVLTMEDWTPIFFVQGQGGTPLRQFVLGSAASMFGITSAVLWWTNRPSPSAFVRWYGAALLLVATGLVGVMIQSVFGGVLGWIGRAAQYLGGVYMLVAAIASVRESGVQGISLSEALRESEERFQAFMDNSPGIAWIKDEEGRYVYLSTSYERRFGVTLDTWRGKIDFELWPPEIAQTFRANDLAVLRDGQPRQFVEEIRNADGTLSYWLNSKFLIRDAAGRKFIAGTGVDISERKRMEEALRASEQRWRALMDHVPMPVQGYNSDGVVTYWNRASERVYGYTSAEALGRNLGDLIIPPEVKPYFLHALSASLSLDASGEFMPAGEIELLCKDGSRISLHSTHTAVCIPGCLPMLFCLDMDLTERKRAEEAAQTALNRFYLVLSNLSVGVLLVTEDGRIEFANQSFCDIFNLKESPADLATLTSREMIERIRTAYVNPEEAVAHIMEIVDRGQPVKDEDVAMSGERTFLRDFVPIRLGEKKYGRLWIHRDITERKRAEEVLRESGQRLREARGLLEAVTLGSKVLIVTVDKEFRYTFFNREHHEELKRLTGKETTLGMSLMKVLAEMPEERDKAIALWRRALKGETVVQTMVFGDPGRHRRWYNTRHVPIRDAGGAIVGAGEVTSDVTELMQAQEALQESETRYRVLFDTMSEGFALHEIVTDAQGQPCDYRFLDVNPAFERLTGLQRADLLGKRALEVLPGTEPYWIEKYGRVTLTGEPLHMENYSAVLQRWYEVFAYRPAPGRFAVVFTDITDRKQSEAALRASRAAANNLMQDAVEARKEAEQVSADLRDSQERLALAASGTRIGIFEWNVVDNTVVCTEQYARIMGLSPTTTTTTTTTTLSQRYKYADWAKSVHPEDLPLVEAEQRRCMNERAPFEMEYRVVRSVGEVRWVESRGIFLNGAERQSLRMLGIAMDVTDRKQAEEKLRRTAEELSRSNKELEQFAYVASHDLQEPLRMVTSFAGLLQTRYQGKLDEKANEYLAFTAEGAERMQALVHDLLDYSRVSAKSRVLVPTNAQESLDAALANLKVSMKESGAKVTHDLMPTVMADGPQLARVFQNLIGNAIKFRKADATPEIHVGARRVTNAEFGMRSAECHGEPGKMETSSTPNSALRDPHSNAWLFSVRDNGIGIDPQFGDRIFQIFQRLHTREAYPGTGIGLAICKKIIERHGGWIWVESKLGEGSTFCFTLPAEGSRR